MGLLRPNEVAAYLAISTRQLRDLTRAGSIRYTNVGLQDRETRRYAPEDLVAFIEERRCQFSSALAPRSTRTTLAGEVIDFTIPPPIHVR
ncbi:helix-turn-helix domain-containing protein [Aureimonas altamirensis]|nr:helix-turn-helix domain-containing protein [Aureimonas altamirensis]UHD47411.1 helix-turn-helix domain-containing protein [Aureimonas altamirensis]